MKPDEQETKKLLLVKIGIIIIATAILFLWLANLRSVFANQRVNTDKTWQKISNDMNNSLDQLSNIKTNLLASSSDNAFVKDLLNKANNTNSSTIATSSELKKELTDLINATTSPKRTNCPEYINCMPSIGEARPCIIPPGCEKITQIAY